MSSLARYSCTRFYLGVSNEKCFIKESHMDNGVAIMPWHFLFNVQICFFDIHGMKQWPDFLACVSLIILLVAIVLKLRWMSVTTAFGYIFGFILGAVFNTDGFDPGGGRTNNFWIIWTVGLLLCIIAGLAVDIARRIKHSDK